MPQAGTRTTAPATDGRREVGRPIGLTGWSRRTELQRRRSRPPVRSGQALLYAPHPWAQLGRPAVRRVCEAGRSLAGQGGAGLIGPRVQRGPYGQTSGPGEGRCSRTSRTASPWAHVLVDSRRRGRPQAGPYGVDACLPATHITAADVLLRTREAVNLRVDVTWA